MTEVVRAKMTLPDEEDANEWWAFLKMKGRNPCQKEATSGGWTFGFDQPIPQLSKAEGQPLIQNAHWFQPEYAQQYGSQGDRPDFFKCASEVSHDSEHSQCDTQAMYDFDHTGEPTRCAFHSRATAEKD